MKKLLLAAVLSLGAITLSTTQAQAGQQTLCINDSEHMMEFDGSTLCRDGENTAATEDDGYYMLTIHEDDISMVMARWPTADISQLSVSEIESGSSYIVTMHTSGVNRTAGDVYVYARYRDEVDRLISAIQYISDSADRNSDLPGE